MLNRITKLARARLSATFSHYHPPISHTRHQPPALPSIEIGTHTHEHIHTRIHMHT